MNEKLEKELKAFIASLAGYNDPAKQLAKILLASLKAAKEKKD